ncbi:MAG: tellurium resistance TerZ family protein [Micavibrio sp.]|nr:tellurium resistance TerZ family protein [Micavibrio sp.]
MPKMEAGQTVPLNVTRESQWRVLCGLGWDPVEGTIIDKAKAFAQGKSSHHDLDLSCYLYDAQGRCIGEVSAAEGRLTDQTGKIYHSGDNIEGVGDGDDEQISVELKDLDTVIHSIIFVASIKSGHSFDEINSPEVRLADGYSGHNFMYEALNGDNGVGKNRYIFARLFKDALGIWMIDFINTYETAEDGDDLSALLKKHL